MSEAVDDGDDFEQQLWRRPRGYIETVLYEKRGVVISTGYTSLLLLRFHPKTVEAADA